MKLLIVMSGGFDTYGPSRHLYHALIEDCLKKGNIVHLIESHSTGTDTDVPADFLKNPNFTYEIIRQKCAKKKQFVKRYINGFLYTLKCRKPLRKTRDHYDVAMVQSCVWAPFMVPEVKKMTRATVLWNIQDMFPGASIANGVLKNKLLGKFFYALHKRAYKNADWISVISEDMAKKVIEQRFDEKRISVIYDWFDDTSVFEIAWENNLFVKKYNLKKDVFYVQYAGTMGFNFDYRLVVKVAKILQDYKDIVFQMIGFGSQMNDFINAVKEEKLTNFMFLPLQEQNMVSHVYSSCDVCLIPLPKGVIGNSVPSKIGLLMACKRPVISSSDANSEYIKMINNNAFGFGCSVDNHELIAQYILELKNNPSLKKQMGINGYNYGSVIYSRKYNVNKYLELFDFLTSEKRKNENK